MKKFLSIMVMVMVMVFLFVSSMAFASIPSVSEQYKVTRTFIYDNVGESNYTFNNVEEFYEGICISMEKELSGAWVAFEKKSLKEVKGHISESFWDDLIKIIIKEGKFRVFIFDFAKETIPKKKFEHILQEQDLNSTIIVIEKI